MSDIIGNALLDAFERRGYRAVTLDPETVDVTGPDGETWTINTADWRQEAGRNSRAELPRLAAEFVQKMTTAFGREKAEIDRVLAAGQLRLRIYYEEDLGDLVDDLVTRPLAAGLLETVVIDYPESLSPLTRETLGDVPENEAFGAAIRWSLENEPHYTQDDEIYGIPITHVGEAHRYIGAHLYLLNRHVRQAAPFGALISVPIPEYVIIQVIGTDHHIFGALEAMQDLARTHYEKGEKPITPLVYWWRPGEYERLPEPDAFFSGLGPELLPVGIEVDHEDKSVAALTNPTAELIDLWMTSQQ
ncbi:hypothetical protein [Spirillospora sp. NPDC047279]|uniref:hypothetical protein n=1 Tax=Spirillospora sp. NPDC047279 TaxID=3155478 RepID=UPI0033DAD1C1